MQLLEDDDLDTGEELPINALPELTNETRKRNPNQQNPRHPIRTFLKFFFRHLKKEPTPNLQKSICQ